MPNKLEDLSIVELKAHIFDMQNYLQVVKEHLFVKLEEEKKKPKTEEPIK